MSRAEHKRAPPYGEGEITSAWEPLSDEMMNGIKLAAFICRMYGDGERWAEVILSHGEQVRGLWWMERERLDAEKRSGK